MYRHIYVYYSRKPHQFCHLEAFSMKPNKNIFLKYILPANIVNNFMVSSTDLECKYVQ